MRVFAVYIWHSEGWTPRNEALMEAVVKQARTAWHPWLIACDANVCPEDFKKSLLFKSRHMFIEAPGVSTRKGPNGEFVERTYDHVIASHSLQGKIKDMEVVDVKTNPEETCPEKMTVIVGIPSYARRTFSSSWLRGEVEGKAEGRQKLDKEGQEEDSNTGEREVKAESKTVETSSERICPNRLSCPALCEKCFEVFSDSEVERVGKSGDFSVCVLAVPSVASAVTVPLSDENVVCEVVFSDSNCECVEPQTFFSLQKTR